MKNSMTRRAWNSGLSVTCLATSIACFLILLPIASANINGLNERRANERGNNDETLRKILQLINWGGASGVEIPPPTHLIGQSPAKVRENALKRARYNSMIGSEFLGKRSSEEPIEFNNEDNIDNDKRMGSEFLGKRMGSEFLGKRMGSEFLGKRMGSEFLGKRMGSEFLGKRSGAEFTAEGGPSNDDDTVGVVLLTPRKREAPNYVTKRVGSEFLGKKKPEIFEFSTIGKKPQSVNGSLLTSENEASNSDPRLSPDGTFDLHDPTILDRETAKRYSEFLGGPGKKRFSEFLGGPGKRFSEFLGGPGKRQLYDFYRDSDGTVQVRPVTSSQEYRAATKRLAEYLTKGEGQGANYRLRLKYTQPEGSEFLGGPGK